MTAIKAEGKIKKQQRECMGVWESSIVPPARKEHGDRNWLVWPPAEADSVQITPVLLEYHHIWAQSLT